MTKEITESSATLALDYYHGDIEHISEEELVIIRQRYEKLAADLLQIIRTNVQSLSADRILQEEQKASELFKQVVLSQALEYFRVELDHDEFVLLATNHEGNFGSLADVAVAVAQQKLVEARLIEEYHLEDQCEFVGYVQRALKTIEAVRMLMREEKPADMPNLGILLDLLLFSGADDTKLSERGLVTKRIAGIQNITQDELQWMGEYFEANKNWPRVLPYEESRER